MFSDQSVQVSFRRIRSDLHFSPGLGLSLVCETGGNYFKLFLLTEIQIKHNKI